MNHFVRLNIVNEEKRGEDNFVLYIDADNETEAVEEFLKSRRCSTEGIDYKDRMLSCRNVRCERIRM